MLMNIIQFQFTNTTDDEQDLIPSFCDWLGSILYSNIDTKINRRKIDLRLNYIIDEAQWINWTNDKYNLTVSEIMYAIQDSITYKQYKDNIWKIIINPNILIPHSYTSIDRLVRFLNYGDNIQRATGIFTNLEREYNFNKLNTLWNMFILRNLGGMSNTKIITR